jgi:catechol 2,3-dioxygenase-like lactoylglutathione lyase family enzyme
VPLVVVRSSRSLRYGLGMLKVGSIVIRVDDLPREVAFWTAALGYLSREDPDAPGADFALLHSPDGGGPNVSLDRVRAVLGIPPKIHLDLYADDQTAEVERLKGLGATEIHWGKRPADADYIIMADPEGNRFCVIDTRPRPGS